MCLKNYVTSLLVLVHKFTIRNWTSRLEQVDRTSRLKQVDIFPPFLYRNNHRTSQRVKYDWCEITYNAKIVLLHMRSYTLNKHFTFPHDQFNWQLMHKLTHSNNTRITITKPGHSPGSPVEFLQYLVLRYISKLTFRRHDSIFYFHISIEEFRS